MVYDLRQFNKKFWDGVIMNLLTSILALFITAGFIVFFFYFGLIFITIAFASFIFLWMIIMIRIWWLRLRYGSNSIVLNEETNITNAAKTTIIDVEYQDISDKK